MVAVFSLVNEYSRPHVLSVPFYGVFGSYGVRLCASAAKIALRASQAVREMGVMVNHGLPFIWLNNQVSRQALKMTAAML